MENEVDNNMENEMDSANSLGYIHRNDAMDKEQGG